MASKCVKYNAQSGENCVRTHLEQSYFQITGLLQLSCGPLVLFSGVLYPHWEVSKHHFVLCSLTCVCVCVPVCARLYLSLPVCVCVCVCVCG